MSAPIQISKSDVRRALAAYQFQQGSLPATLERLRSVQIDPLSPAGRNHDLVLQVRAASYKIDDWQKAAYQKRQVYDGWDKQACLVLMSSWPTRRIYADWQGGWLERLNQDYPHAVEAVLKELQERGPLLPREFHFQERQPEWKGSWYGENLVKQSLRALTHAGRVVTHSRSGQQHRYELAERVVPAPLFAAPRLTNDEMLRQLVLWRHETMGLIRPNAPWEVWSFQNKTGPRREAIASLVKDGKLFPVEVEGVRAHAVPEFLQALDAKPHRGVRFVAPLDPFMWDRKMIEHLFGFEYLWEVYVPPSKRRWGYYVLPVLHGDMLVARFEPWVRDGLLEIRGWMWETKPTKGFWGQFEQAIRRFARYSSFGEAAAAPSVDPRVTEAVKRALTSE